MTRASPAECYGVPIVGPMLVIMHITYSKLCLIVVALLSEAVVVYGITAAQLDATGSAGDTSNCDNVNKYIINNDRDSPDSVRWNRALQHMEKC
nr:hypothetical protein CFP56_33602 [Quercus suber]